MLNSKVCPFCWLIQNIRSCTVYIGLILRWNLFFPLSMFYGGTSSFPFQCSMVEPLLSSFNVLWWNLFFPLSMFYGHQEPLLSPFNVLWWNLFFPLSMFYGGTSSFLYLLFVVSSFFFLFLFRVNSLMFTVWFDLSCWYW